MSWMRRSTAAFESAADGALEPAAEYTLGAVFTSPGEVVPVPDTAVEPDGAPRLCVRDESVGGAPGPVEPGLAPEGKRCAAYTCSAASFEGGTTMGPNVADVEGVSAGSASGAKGVAGAGTREVSKKGSVCSSFGLPGAARRRLRK